MMVESIIQPKEPRGSGWSRGPEAPTQYTLGYPGRYWFHKTTGLVVISAVEVAKDPHDLDKGPEYHVSVSKRSHRRASSAECSFVIRAFGIQGAEEDNHVPFGIVRNFWLPVAENLIGHECPCKATEPAIVEDKGEYIWRAL